MKPYFLLLKTIQASPIVNICYFLWENRLEVEGWGGDSLIPNEEICNPGDLGLLMKQTNVKLVKINKNVWYIMNMEYIWTVFLENQMYSSYGITM